MNDTHSTKIPLPRVNGHAPGADSNGGTGIVEGAPAC
jgi:hypothetical protein